MTRVNHLLEDFSDHNLLLQMLLGLLSETERIERLLPRPAAAGRRADRMVDDSFVAALLGIVSLRAQLVNVVGPSLDARRKRAGGKLLRNDRRSVRRRGQTIRELMR